MFFSLTRLLLNLLDVGLMYEQNDNHTNHKYAL